MNENVGPGPGGWATVETATVVGIQAVRAQLIGPWCAHRGVPDGWLVTHTASGVKVPALLLVEREGRS